MKRTVFFISALVFVSAAFSQDADGTLFEFKYKKDDSSRILSTVDEAVFVNGALNHRAQILNRIFCKVTDVLDDGSAAHEASFMTSETSVGGRGGSFSWGQEYDSAFVRTRTGKYTIEDIYFMPTVRDVPVFPEYPVKKGGKWSAEGHEAHDLRMAFNIQKPFRVPFTAQYEYVDDEIDGNTGRTLNLIEVTYSMYFESPRPSSITRDILNAPAVTMGHSSQKIWWDNQKGMIDHYSEEFKIIIETFYGDQITFSGTAHAEVTEFKRVSTEENLRKISESVSNLGYGNIGVAQGEKGVTISIENIQFEPDSAVLMESEKVKLEKIAEILKTFDNDLLITGPCADRGTKQTQMRISEDRAVSVAEYLSLLNVRNPNCIFTEGKGASVPVAPNTTEQGRAKNRRVEITIMDE